MRDKILKIAGVKSEEEFYKKFPTEEAFMKVHGKAFEKARKGAKLPKYQYSGDGLPIAKPEDYTWQNFPTNPQGNPMLNPNTPPPVLDPTQTGTLQQQIDVSNKVMGAKTPIDWKGALKDAGAIMGGVQALKTEREAVRKARQNKELSGVMAQAATVQDQPINRRYVRPEDMAFTSEQLFPTYGVGTNYLSAEHGTEIQNTYAPSDLYSDLQFEPLSDSSKIKQYQSGGLLDFANAGGADFLNQGINMFGQNAGGQLGSSIGKTAGTLLGGPVGGLIGSVGGNLIGRAFDTNPRRIKDYNEQTNRNATQIMGANVGQGLHYQFSSLMKEGGYMNPNYNPQVITKFGSVDMSDLRSGGNIRRNEALDGELRTHWGGYPETVSSNPYLPGDSIMFKGNSHDESDGRGNTGIGVTFGKSSVEVEGGEPAQKLQNGGSPESLVVFGDLKIPNTFLSEIGDPAAKGKKFKNYVADLNKKEERSNKVIDKSVKKLNELQDLTSFDQLSAASYGANILGSNMRLKAIAEKKQNAAAVQDAINSTAAEHGISASELAKGKIKKDRSAAINAQDGTIIGPTPDDYLKSLYSQAQMTKDPKAVKFFQKEFHTYYPELARKVIGEYDVTNYGKQQKLPKSDLRSNEEGLWGPRTERYMAELNARGLPQSAPGTPSAITTPPASKKEAPLDMVAPNKRKWWIDAANSILPYFRPSDAEGLDYSQLLGEMYALSDKVEPVPAQLYHPQLDQPFDISLQDQLNANQADFNAISRSTQYNPAAQSSLAAQKYEANSRILGEQFRANQANKAEVFAGNRNLLNDAQLKNLGILDQQMVRQETAKSNTKARYLSALNSISDKIAKNKLENRTLGIYENLYNYRYDKSGRAINMNPLQQFDVAADFATPRQRTDLPQGYEYIYNSQGEPIDIKKTAKARNGSIVKAIKNM